MILSLGGAKAQEFVFDSTFISPNYPYVMLTDITGITELNDSTFIAFGNMNDVLFPELPSRLVFFDKRDYHYRQPFDSLLNKPFNMGAYTQMPVDGPVVVSNDSIYAIGHYPYKLSVNVGFDFDYNLQVVYGPLLSAFGGASRFCFIDENQKWLGGLVGMQDFIVQGSDSITPGGFQLFRINSDGSYDHTFHHDVDRHISRIMKEKDSTYLISGSFQHYDQFETSNLVRIDSDGNLLDSCKAFKQSALQSPDILYIDEDGKILLSGYIILEDFPDNVFALVRLNSDFSLDTTFRFDLYPRYCNDTIYTCENFISSALKIGDNYLMGGGGRITANEQYFLGLFLTDNHGVIKEDYFKDNLILDKPGWELALRVYDIKKMGDYIYAVGNFTGFGNVQTGPLIRFKIQNQEQDPQPISDFTGFSIAPNPVNDLLTIHLNGYSPRAEYVIYDLAGKVLVQSVIDEGEQSFGIDLQNFSTGSYFIKINQQTSKFIKL
jgi:hypothetical protein